MAFIIDERVAGGRPQKLTTPSIASFGVATERAIQIVRTNQVISNRPRTRRILAWARA